MGRVLWGSSSPGKDGCIPQVLVDHTLDDGTRMCALVRTEIVCVLCKAKDLLFCDHHFTRQLAHQGDPHKERILREIYSKHAGTAYQKEILGLQSTTNNSCFPKELVDRAMSTPGPFGSDTKYMFVGIDPAGRGPSEVGCAVGAYHKGTFVVRGAAV
jgi:hypothetical protein